ncbi:DHH family phosphoesterase [Candidatus Woesearchaeota archaeon]|nr:MAG: DHH family phosphoesterase [Candidatus Woesearchaeota archaeon]
MYAAFKNLIEESARRFQLLDKKEIIRVVSHLDADGICSAAIMINALNKENRRYTISILPQLKEENLKELAKESGNIFVFTDLGSGQLDVIHKVLHHKTVFILDHHVPQSEKTAKNIIHVNPCLHGIDGSTVISGAGVVYLFSKALLQNTEMSHIAIIGAIGDIQDKEGFSDLNKEILNDAVASGKMQVTQGLKFFGLQTRPLPKLLQYSTDTVIPGVTGSESNAIQFLMSLGIHPKNGNGWKRLTDLTDEEKQKLVAGIIMKRVDLPRPDNIFTDVYLLTEENDTSPLKEAKEFSTLLNACGRMNKASLGIGACLNDKKLKAQAVRHLVNYKREIMNALTWFSENKHNSAIVIKKDNYMIINAETSIMATMIGTLTSILSKNNDFKPNYYLLGMAQNDDLTTKISLRITGNSEDVNLKDIINQMIALLGHGEGGGHPYAAGAVIKTDDEASFLKIAQQVLDKVVMEEHIA